ncbi:hypothetical protein N2152v2_007340 [Parachlorella kessleri]
MLQNLGAQRLSRRWRPLPSERQNASPCLRPAPRLRRNHQQAASPPPHVRTLAAQATTETVEFSADEEADMYIDRYVGGRREGGGYTPFEFISFSEIVLRHELVQRVEAPVAKCFQIWKDRFNWMQWFDMIEEVGFHEEDANLMSMFFWYRWASTPFLELFVTLERTECEENKHIMEEPVGGAPLVAAVLFEEQGPQATLVRLRISYQLPEVLRDFAGQMAVWGDVDRKLQASMARMALFVEAADLAALQEQRARDWQLVEEGFPEDRRLREEAWAAEEARVAELQEQGQEEEESGSEGEGAEEEGPAAAAGAAAAPAAADGGLGVEEEGLIDMLAGGQLGQVQEQQQQEQQEPSEPDSSAGPRTRTAGEVRRNPASKRRAAPAQQQQADASTPQSPADALAAASATAAEAAAGQPAAAEQAAAAEPAAAGLPGPAAEAAAAAEGGGGKGRGRKAKAKAEGEPGKEAEAGKKPKRGRPRKTAPTE